MHLIIIIRPTVFFIVIHTRGAGRGQGGESLKIKIKRYVLKMVNEVRAIST